VYYTARGRKIGVFSARRNTEARASFYFASPPIEYDHRDLAQQKRILRERFAGEEWEAPRLLRMMEEAPDFYFDSISQIRMERWSAGRCVLVGDAGYCPSPMSGMGTSMAMVGAYVLAGELKHANGDYSAAFARYETRMRDFVARCQKLAEGLDWFVPRTRSKLWLSRQMWRMLPYTPWKNMMIELPMKAANSIRLENW
jgi:2-polyprenyl-6-methoxyphenol hydroxylase-like FAD-dependent oxidoreductase